MVKGLDWCKEVLEDLEELDSVKDLWEDKICGEVIVDTLFGNIGIMGDLKNIVELISGIVKQ